MHTVQQAQPLPPFMVKETEAQRGAVTCPSSHGWHKIGSGSKPGRQAAGTQLVTTARPSGVSFCHRTGCFTWSSLRDSVILH